MRILVISDEESKLLWDFFRPSKLENVDLILSCGDLDPDYLSFLATKAKCPVYYVHGNHDEKYLTHPPEGCICLDDQIITYRGIRILGLGGSGRYDGGVFQYTEREMQKRIRKLRFELVKSHGFDILLTHAPARGLNDTEHPAHQGFNAFRTLLEDYSPKYFIHGHVHLTYGSDIPRVCQHLGTTVINGYESYYFDY